MVRHLVLAVAVVVACVGSVLAQPAPATVVTLGEAVIRMPPDRVFLTLMTEWRGQTAQEAQAKGTAAMKAVQQAVDKLRLSGGSVMTTGVWLSEDYDFSNNQRRMRGYVDRHSIVVRLDDISRAGEVLSAAVNAGATNVNGIRFDRRDRETLEEQALKQAVQVARARADALAAGARRVVDRVIRIAEEQAVCERPVYERVAGQAMVGGPGVPVASGEVEVRVRVVLTATLK